MDFSKIVQKRYWNSCYQYYELQFAKTVFFLLALSFHSLFTKTLNIKRCNTLEHFEL